MQLAGFIYKIKYMFLCSRFFRYAQKILHIMSQQNVEMLTSENALLDLYSFFSMYFIPQNIVLLITAIIQFLFFFFSIFECCKFYPGRILCFRQDVCHLFSHFSEKCSVFYEEPTAI